ncbi:MAG: hypothetical protein KC442_08305, partial [Thermomicrobiales bacterium]|nr:hypothetical protein [Thermomicrobiales bacterium]
MNQAPPVDLAALTDSLRAMGYDIEPETPGRPAGSAVIARRDLGERTVLLAIDRAGRFRADLTWLVGEWPAQVTLAGVALRCADRVIREATLTGQLASIAEATAVVAHLGAIEPWAAPG